MIKSSVFSGQLFSGKALFVAGGTSGINRGIATRFAQLGANVFVISRSEEIRIRNAN